MNHILDPLQNKYLFKQMLLRLKERNELDDLLIEFISAILEHRIYHWPSIGRFGEQGKDIVAIENKETNDYCSYIMKSGNLNDNLEGQYGILKQLEDAMYININDEFKASKRTARVVYNGIDGYRGSVAQFDEKKNEIHEETGDLLLRDIERWDIEVIADHIFPHANKLRKAEKFKMDLERLNKKENILDNFIRNINVFKNELSSNPVIDQLIKEYNEIENNFGAGRNEDESQ